MRIVVNHLTRMKAPYVCVAGIDMVQATQVRPVAQTQLNRSVTTLAGGVFGIGSIVDLGNTTPAPSPPEVEDVRFDPTAAKLVRQMGAKTFWGLLTSAADSSLSSIFGNALKRQRNSFAVDADQGTGSLGCWAPNVAFDLFVNQWNKVTISTTVDGDRLFLPVTDLRLVEDDQVTPRRKRVDELAARIASGVDVILSVGLARKYKINGDTEQRHWFQVNNVHLADEPIW